jgi:hypothetical protein
LNVRSLPLKHWSYPLIALLAGAVMIVRAVLVTEVYSNTVDEPYHIGAAMVLWESKQAVAGAQHPPLARWVIGLPLVLQGVSFPEARNEYVVVEFPAFGIGHDILFFGKLPYWQMLNAARHALLIFSALALFYLYRLGRYLANPLVAMLAVVFFSTDPTFLAHSALIGTDAAGCAGFVAGLYYGLRFIAKPWRAGGRAAPAGLVLGLAIASKFSCLLLIPSLVLVALVRVGLAHRKTDMLRRLFPVRSIALICGVAFLVIWAVYGFAVNPLRQQAMLVHESAWTRIPQIVREQPIPMPSFWLGQLFLASRAGSSGQLTYLNGELSYQGWPLYFPEALVLKEPIGFLIALVVACAIAALVKRRPRRALRMLCLLIPIGFFFAVSIRSRYQIGIRHLLPILPLMYLFAVMHFVRVRRAIPLMALIALTFVETALMHPDYLAFFNFACGGPRHGDRYLLDSNFDWGQDMARLAAWLKSDEAKGRPYSIRCSYVNGQLLTALGLDAAALGGKPHGLLAISKNVQHRFQVAERDESPDGSVILGEDYSWLSRYPVVKRIGYSIDVYDLDAKDSSHK